MTAISSQSMKAAISLPLQSETEHICFLICCLSRSLIKPIQVSENKASLTQLPVNTVLPIHKKKKKNKTKQNRTKQPQNQPETAGVQ